MRSSLTPSILGMKFVRRRYSRRRVPGPALVFALCLLVLLLPASAGATNHRIRVEQVMVGANFDVDVQFIEMKFEFPGQNNWSGSPARARLTFHDASGAQTGEFPFPTNPSDSGPSDPENAGLSVLIATQAFVDETGLAPDFVLPSSMLSASSGMVCFTNNPASGSRFPVNACLAYGNFTGPQESDCVDPPTGNFCCFSGETLNGSPAPALSSSGAPRSLNRFQDLVGQNNDFECGQENSNFQLETPVPRNAAGQTVTITAPALPVPALSNRGLLSMVAVLACASACVLRSQRMQRR